MDKNHERRIFNQTYQPVSRWTVKPSESPDFICIRDGKPVLGVEVTELWQHEADARLSKINGYLTSLLDGGEVMHKDDRSIAKIETIQLLPNNSLEPIAEIPAIMRKHPSPSECTRLLSSVLDLKENRISEYQLQCARIDLVIDDRSMLFWHNDFEELIRPISDSSLRKKVIKSSFREIFLLTGTRENQRIRVPLKANLLMEDLLVLELLLSECAPDLSNQLYSADCSSPIAVSAMIAALADIYDAPPIICLEEDRIGIPIGCMTIHWTTHGKVIRDYTCIPEQVEPVGDRILFCDETSKISQQIAKQRFDHQAAISLSTPVTNPQDI